MTSTIGSSCSPGSSISARPAKLDALAAGMRACDAPFDELNPDDVVARFPELRPRSGERALFHAEAGTVLAEAAMRALRREAEAAGAELSEPESAVAAGRVR